MRRKIRLLVGISILWLALSMLTDGMSTLVLPVQLSNQTEPGTQATLLGISTFIGLLAAAFIQPIAGAYSDWLKPRLGRRGFIAIGILLCLVSLSLFAVFHHLILLLAAFVMIQVSASIAQAGQQGFIPDLVDEKHRGIASGWKGFMDIAGAMLGFVLLGQLLGEGRSTLAIMTIAAVLLLAYFLTVILTPEDHSSSRHVTNPPLAWKQIFRLNPAGDKPFIRLIAARFLFLFGIYATGRFLLFFVADRLGLEAGQAAEQAGSLLAGLALITVAASPVTGWLADRIGRIPLMVIGSILGGVSSLLLIAAKTPFQILLFGGLMSIASAAFSGGSWALLADLVPKADAARYFGLANFSTAGSAAAAGLLGPLMDASESVWQGSRFTVLFIGAAIAFIASTLPIRNTQWKEVRNDRERIQKQGKAGTDDPGLAVIPVPANPAPAEKDQHTP